MLHKLCAKESQNHRFNLHHVVEPLSCSLQSVQNLIQNPSDSHPAPLDILSIFLLNREYHHVETFWSYLPACYAWLRPAGVPPPVITMWGIKQPYIHIVADKEFAQLAHHGHKNLHGISRPSIPCTTNLERITATFHTNALEFRVDRWRSLPAAWAKNWH